MPKTKCSLQHRHDVRHRLFPAIIATTIAIALTTGQTVAGSHDPVTSTGQELAPSPDLSTRAMEAFDGQSAVEALQKGADAVGQLSNEDLNALLGLKAAGTK